jgi:hypothetical protein
MKRSNHNRKAFSYRLKKAIYRLLWETDITKGIQELIAGIGIFLLIFLFLIIGTMFR